MRRKVLVGLAVFAVIGVGAGVVFAQQAAADILSWDGPTRVKAANKNISGEVVIPAIMSKSSLTYEVKSIAQSGFDGCTQITSVTMLGGAGGSIGQNAFTNCGRLTSFTFGASGMTVYTNSFPGDLAAKYKAGGSGTYTRRPGSNEWFKGGSGGGGGGGKPKMSGKFCSCCGKPLD